MSFYNYYPNRKDWRDPQDIHTKCERCHRSKCIRSEQASLSELVAYRKGFYSVHIYDPADENEYNYFNSHISEHVPY